MNIIESWKENNEKFFGVPCVPLGSDYNYIMSKIPKFEDKWNSKNPAEWPEICALLRRKYENQDVRFKIKFNFSSYSVIISNKYMEKNIFTVPVVYENGNWMIGKSLQAPRGVATRNRRDIGKIDNIVTLPSCWRFNCNTGEFEQFKVKKKNALTGKNEVIYFPEVMDTSAKSITKNEYNMIYMKTFCPDFDENESEEKFKEHLMSLPDTNFQSVLNYIWSDYTFFFDKIREAIDFHNSNSTIIISLNKIISANGRKNSNIIDDEDIGSFLTLNTENNSHFSMSNIRSCILNTNTEQRQFQFMDCMPFFDAYKVSTSKNAGILRLLLDDVIIKDGMLWKEIDGKLYNQFEVYKMVYMDGVKLKSSCLSSFSESPFNQKDGPKRIMMTGKAYSQSIPVVGECEPFHHSVMTRVLFSDFYGYTIGDGIIVSESYAKKMVSPNSEYISVSKIMKPLIEEFYDFEKNEPKKDLTLAAYIELKGKNSLKFQRYEGLKIVKCEFINGKYSLNISWFISLQPGDKVTTLHGSKGVISLILPDEMMPVLKEDFGDMKAGPFELIISSYGVVDRKNLGQIYEANHNCNAGEMSYEGKVEFRGKTYTKAFGILTILRLYHTNIVHESFSRVDGKHFEQINLGEMELNALSIQDNEEMMIEMSRRSNRNSGKPEDYIYGDVEAKIDDTNMFLNIFKCLGYDFELIID